MITLTINGTEHRVEHDPGEPLLWVLRDRLGMTGTKYGCGAGLCGACTVLVDGVAVRSCSSSAEEFGGRHVQTIEDLDDPVIAAVRAAWLHRQVPQCGYCQAGFVLAVSAELKARPDASAGEVLDAITNLCRCGTYPRIRAAVADLAGEAVR